MNTGFNARRKLIRLFPVGIALLAAGCAAVPGQSGADALLQQGQQLYNAKQFDEAIAKFRQAVALEPSNGGTWLWLARCHIAKGGWGDAIAAARRALELSPQGAEVMQIFLQALFGGGAQALGGGNFVDSIKYFSEYLKYNGSNAGAWVNVGKAYLGNKQFADALQALVRALGITGADRADVAGTLLAGGLQAAKERDFSGAIALLREYIKQDPRNLQAYLALAKSYWESGQKGGALEAVRDALKVSPANGEALQLLRQLL